MLSKRSSMSVLSTIVVMGALSVGCAAKEDGPEGNAGAAGSGSGGTGAGNGGTSGEGGSGTGGGNAGTNGNTGGSAGTGNTGGSGGVGVSGGSGGTDPVDEMTKEERFPEVTDWAALDVVFPNAYTAFDGEHDFSVPFRVQDTQVALADWFSIPADAVTFDEDPERVDNEDGPGVIVTIANYYPEITIGAQSGMLGGTGVLKVTQATPEEWAAGLARYDNGIEYELPELTPEEFAKLLLDPEYEIPAPEPNTSCITCHSTGAKYFEIQHTPTQAARFSDEELTNILSMGMKPEGIGFRILPDMLGSKTNFEIYGEMHRWDGTPEEIKGLLVYLRSLPPTGQGDIKLPDGTYVEPGTMPPPP